INLNPISEVDERLSSQLAEIDNQRFFESMVNRKKKRRGMITPIDDDGDKGVYTKLRPLALEYGITFTSALATGFPRGVDGGPTSDKYINIDEILQMRDEGSVEFIGHSDTHPHLRELTLSELRDEFSKSQAFLKRFALNHRAMVFPYNQVNQQIMDEVRSYFDYAFGNAPHGVVKPPFDNYYIPRNVIHFDKDITHLKALIDQAAEEDRWVILYTHVDQGVYSESKMRELIEYALSKGLEFVTSDEGMKHNGNIAQLQIPKYTDFAPDNIDDIDINTSEGETLSDELGRSVVDFEDTVVNDTHINHFKDKAVTYTRVNASNRFGFPEELPGILTTYNIRFAETYWAWQEYKPHKSQSKYIRRFDMDNDEWVDWEIINGYRIDTSTIINNNTPVTYFPANTVTESIIRSSQSSGFPN